MTPADLHRALERLTTCRHVVMEMPAIIRTTDFAPQLAALIEAAVTRELCRICGGDNKAYFAGGYKELPDGVRHKPDCALVALVRAINGGAP